MVRARSDMRAWPCFKLDCEKLVVLHFPFNNASIAVKLRRSRVGGRAKRTA